MRKHFLLALAVPAVLLVAAAPAAARPVACGDTVARSIELRADLRGCTGTALTVTGPNVTLNLGGHVVEGDVSAPEQDTPRARLVIKNGAVRGIVGIASYRKARVAGLQASYVFLNGVAEADVAHSRLGGLDVVQGVAADVHDNRLHGDRGISILRTRKATIVGNLVEHSQAGVSVLHSGRATLTRNVLRRNEVGLDASYSTVTALRNRITGNGFAGVALSDVQVELVGNRIARNGGDGVGIGLAHGLVSGNRTDRNGDDGIDLKEYTSGVRVEGNRARFNVDFGIEATPGVVDWGSNRAWGNGTALQCLNVACGGRAAG
jgi:hypothetical protein